MERSAVAYLSNGTLLVAPVIRTTTGLGLEVEPSAVGSPDQSSVAEALSRALDRSGRVVPHPSQDEWKGFFNPFLEAAGVRNHKAFMKDARRVSIRMADDRLKLTPQRNLGSKEGFEAIPDAALHVARDDLSGAAAALLQLLGD